MGEVQDRRQALYCSTQSVRDEASAPTHVDTAGDQLVKELSERQRRTSVTLTEHLNAEERFQPASYRVLPSTSSGIMKPSQLLSSEEATDEQRFDQAGPEPVLSFEELRERTGMSRHELEVVLTEKPNSDISRLYKFALNSTRKPKTINELESQLPDHPINHLKEIEEEYFGHLKRNREEAEVIQEEEVEVEEENNLSENLNEGGNESGVLGKKRKRRRKRRNKKKAGGDLNIETQETESESGGEEEVDAVGCGDGRTPRPSLWDVKDMRAFCQEQPKHTKIYTCQPRTLYTLRDGKIVRLDNSQSS